MSLSRKLSQTTKTTRQLKQLKKRNKLRPRNNNGKAKHHQPHYRAATGIAYIGRSGAGCFCGAFYVFCEPRHFHPGPVTSRGIPVWQPPCLLSSGMLGGSRGGGDACYYLANLSFVRPALYRTKNVCLNYCFLSLCCYLSPALSLLPGYLSLTIVVLEAAEGVAQSRERERIL